MADEAAATFFANLEQDRHTQADEGAEDFFAQLNSTAPTSSSSAKVILKKEKKTTKPSTKKSKQPKDQVVATKTDENHRAECKDEAGADQASVVVSTEERIVSLLVPGMTVPEIMTLVKKMRQAGKSESDEFTTTQESDLKTGPRFICDSCGNTEQNNFITDYARGDTICRGKDGSGCGTVVQDHIVHEGSAYRKFEGEEDKSHHGPAPNKLFSSGHNLRTLISDEGTEAANLRRAADFVEMNLSQMGKDERRTRIGYKDQMKRKACSMIDHVAANLDLHEMIVMKAKEMFAEFRDLREHVHQFEAVVAGCILASYIETSADLLAMADRQKQQRLLSDSTHLAIEQEALSFRCPWCKFSFNAKRGLQFHNCDLKPSEDQNTTNMDVSTPPLSTAGADTFDVPHREEKAEHDNEEARAAEPDKMQPLIELRDGKKWLKCAICPRSFLTLVKFEDHVKRHVNQNKKRKHFVSTVDTSRLAKTNTLVSANPSVQVNQNEKVLFRGQGRRPWLQYLAKAENYTPEPSSSN